MGQTRKQQPSLSLDVETGALSGLDVETGALSGLDSGSEALPGPDAGTEALSGLDAGTEDFSGLDAGARAISWLWSGARAHSLFLLNLLLWAEVKEIAAVIIGLGSESAGGIYQHILYLPSSTVQWCLGGWCGDGSWPRYRTENSVWRRQMPSKRRAHWIPWQTPPKEGSYGLGWQISRGFPLQREKNKLSENGNQKRGEVFNGGGKCQYCVENFILF